MPSHHVAGTHTKQGEFPTRCLEVLLCKREVDIIVIVLLADLLEHTRDGRRPAEVRAHGRLHAGAGEVNEGGALTLRADCARNA